MNKINVLLWNLISLSTFFSGGVIRTKGRIYDEVGSIIRINKFKDGYATIDIGEWTECNTKSSLSTWSLGKNPCNKLHVENVEVSIGLRYFGLVIKFSVPGLGQCEVTKD